MKFPIQIAGMTLASLLLAACDGAQKSQEPETTPAPSDASAQAAAPIPAEEAMTPLFENDYIRVERFDIAPGQSIAEHEGRKRVIYSLDDYTLQWREEGREETTTKWKAGDVHPHDALRHSLTNVGDTPAQFLVFERKEAALPASSTPTLPDATDSDSDHSALLFFNDDFLVMRVSLEPGEMQPTHEGGYRAIYSLTDYVLNWQEGDAPAVQKAWKAGQVHFHEPGSHSAENAGDTTASWLVVTIN